MDIEIIPASVNDKPVIANLLQLYLYDLSEFAEWPLNEHGLFDYPYLDYYWREPERHPFVIRVDTELAGLALVRDYVEDGMLVHQLAEFFILRKFRHRGIGEAAACRIFDQFPGPWNVEQLEQNVAAQRFWRRVVGRYSQGSYTERYDADRGKTVQEFRAREAGSEG